MDSLGIASGHSQSDLLETMNGMGLQREGGVKHNECRVIVLASLSPVAISQVIFVCKRQVMQEIGVEERGQGVSYEACIVLMLLLFSRDKTPRPSCNKKQKPEK